MNEHIIVALLATKGLEDFLQNSLTGLARVGVDPRIVHVARPDNAAHTLDPIIREAGVAVHSFVEFGHVSPDAMPERYVDYGTEPFIAINWHKVRYIRWLLDQYRHVVYADLDVGWLAEPLWYLNAIAKVFPLAFQTEALRRFPPVLCWGFLSARSSEVTLQLLDTMLRDYEARPAEAPLVDEQNTLDAMITQDPGLLEHVHLLSEGLFVNGLGYRNLLDRPAAVTPMLGRLEPFVFHANWTIGLANKRKLMAQTGTWLLGAPEPDAGGE
jgi:Nucleotide-diphospho-sugar transferase